MLTKLTNNIYKTTYALLELTNLNAQKIFSHKFTHRDIFPSLIDCVIDDILRETMPDMDQVLLQFIGVIN